MTQLHHLVVFFLAVTLLSYDPVSSRIYQTEDAIILEGKREVLRGFALWPNFDCNEFTG